MKNIFLFMTIMFLSPSLAATQQCPSKTVSKIGEQTVHRCLYPHKATTADALDKLCITEAKISVGDDCGGSCDVGTTRKCLRVGNPYMPYGHGGQKPSITTPVVSNDPKACNDEESIGCQDPLMVCYEFTIDAPSGIVCPCTCCLQGSSKKGNRRANECVGDFCYICDDPNLVDLDNFTAIIQKDSILLSWKTDSETNSKGFHIWRGTPDLDKYCGCSTNIDNYKQIIITTLDDEGNPALIPAKGDKTSGAEYAYLDENVKPGIPYCYALEELDSNGESKFYFEYILFTPDT